MVLKPMFGDLVSKLFSFIVKNQDDVLYLFLLLYSIVIGRWYNQIRNSVKKKWTGTCIGLGLTFIVSGYNSFHPVFSAILGITAIKVSTVRYCHVVTFIVMFGYLFFFRLADKFGLPLSSGQTNLIEMLIVLRVVGVAFEINGSWLWIFKPKNQEELKEPKLKDDDFVEIIKPTTMDLFHYSFSYIGLLTGPYYRYRTFNDYFILPYHKYAPCFETTLNTLKNVPLYITIYLVLSTIWPLEYVLSDDHNQRHFLYRVMYPWFVFTAFRHRIYAGMTLAECVCTSAGLGAYPVEGKNRAGHGPTVGYLKLKYAPPAEKMTSQLDFKTIECMDVWGCETVVTLRESMKTWNKCVQYWIGMYMHKRFPIKFLKVHVAMFVSVIWHGFYAGYFFCIYFCSFYLMAEDIYYKLYYKDATGKKKKIIGFIMWFLRLHSKSYQGVAFLLLSFDRVWRYYSSVHHYWYWVWFTFLVLGIILNQFHKSAKTKYIESEQKIE